MYNLIKIFKKKLPNKYLLNYLFKNNKYYIFNSKKKKTIITIFGIYLIFS